MALGWPPALFEGAYGSLVIAKSALFVALLAFAAWNRFRLVPALARGHPQARRRVTASIGAELVLIAVTIVVAAALSQTAPPPAAALARGEIVVALRAPALEARMHVAPGRAGINVFTIRFTTQGGAATDPADVVLEFANPKAGAEAIGRRPLRVGRVSIAGPAASSRSRESGRLHCARAVSEFDLVHMDAVVTIE